MSFARIVVTLIAVFCLATGTFVDHGKDAYLHGDYKKALDDWQALALQNNAQAEFGLGFLYAHGYGVTQSYEAAAAGSVAKFEVVASADCHGCSERGSQALNLIRD